MNFGTLAPRANRAQGHDRQGKKIGQDQRHERGHACLLVLLPDLELGGISLNGNGRFFAVLILQGQFLAVDLGDLAFHPLILGGNGADRLARIDPDPCFCTPAENIHPLGMNPG